MFMELSRRTVKTEKGLNFYLSASHDSICIVIVDRYILETRIVFFSDYNEAAMYINMMTF